MRKITKESLFEGNLHGLTVGKLKDFITKFNIPDNAPVLIQRVEDTYFDGVDISGCRGCQDTENGIYPEGSKAEGWGVYLKEDEFCYHQRKINAEMEEEIIRRANGEEPEYPNIKNPADRIIEITDEMCDQYHPAWSCVYYKEDPNILFIDLHY